MRLIDVIPVTRIPHTQTQILSYFFSSDLALGSLVLIPLGKRKETGVVLASRDIDKMQIKKADFSLRNIIQTITEKPVLTNQQIELALFLGQYYFASPGIFLKMTLPPQYSSSPSTSLGVNSRREVLNSNSNNKKLFQKLILTPTIASAKKIAAVHKNTILWHSDLTAKQKDEIWWKIKSGQAQTIVGTRSAAFLPFVNLKEIIIEDAKNSGHRSWDMFPRYESITIAKKLAEIFKCKITAKDFCHPDPANAGEGSLPCRQAGKKDSSSADWQTQNDNLKIIDMREELKAKNFSVFSFALEDAIKEALAQKKQVILFANRRGAANFILCRDCGHVINCPNCEVPMAFHLINGQAKLFCHHCGRKNIPPGRCPVCHDWRIKTVGSGTQKVEKETKIFFPDAKILRLDGDIAPKPKDQQKIIADFIEEKADILIATQIIFSWLTELASVKPSVVAILSADTLLHLPDFRSGERTWQTIATLRQLLYCHPELREGSRGSVATRATKLPDSSVTPRNDKTFIIQTYNPANSAIKYAAQNNWEIFWQEEIETREALNYPPYSQIVKLTFRHRDGKRAGQEAKILAVKLQNVLSFSSVIPAPHQVRGKLEAGIHPAAAGRVKPGMTKNEHADNIEISPALPAFIPRERGKFAWNIILKFPFSSPLFRKEGLGPLRLVGDEAREIYVTSNFLQRRNSLLQYVPQNWEIDVDPESLL